MPAFAIEDFEGVPFGCHNTQSLFRFIVIKWCEVVAHKYALKGAIADGHDVCFWFCPSESFFMDPTKFS